MQMRRIIVVLSIFTALCLSAAAIIAAMTPGYSAAAGTKASGAVSTQTGAYTESLSDEQDAETEASPYRVLIVDGQLTVFKEGVDIPAAVLDINPKSLREADRLAFERGVRLNSYTELIHLLEDFSN